MTLKRLVLHLGMGKTGSSTIQAFLRRNAPLLRRDRYVAVGPDDLDQNPQDNLEDNELLQRAIDEIKGRVRAARAEHLIWSLEGFATLQFLRDPARLAAVRAQLPATEVRVVIYLRRQDDFAASAYLQWNVVNKSYHGPVQSFDERFPSVYGEPNGTPLEHTNLNYHAIIRPWVDAFGLAALRVRPLENAQLVDGDLMRDFRDAASLPDRAYDTGVPRQNQAFHHELTDLMGMYGSVFEGPVRAGDMTFFFRSFGHDPIFDQPFFHRFELPPATRRSIIDACAPINAQVARDFLGRSDGVLFREPVPSPDDPYQPYEGMTLERLVPILLHIMKKQHMQISFLFAEKRRADERFSWSRVRAMIDHKVLPRLHRLLGR